MSMHMERAFLTTTHYGSRSQKPANTAKLRKSQTEHDRWLRKQGLHPEQLQARPRVKVPVVLPDYRTDQSLPVSNNIRVDGGRQTGIMANLHRESPAVQAKIREWAGKVAPLYNKGGLQVVTAGTDITEIGSKSRRG